MYIFKEGCFLYKNGEKIRFFPFEITPLSKLRLSFLMSIRSIQPHISRHLIAWLSVLKPFPKWNKKITKNLSENHETFYIKTYKFAVNLYFDFNMKCAYFPLDLKYSLQKVVILFLLILLSFEAYLYF